MSPRTPSPRWSVAVLSGALLLGLSACTAADAAEVPPPVPAATTVAARPYVPAIQAGDCLDMGGLLSAAADEDALRTVRCDEPHDGEVYAQTTVADAQDPDDVTAHAQTFCADEFADFVGRDLARTDLEVTFLAPTDDSWDEGDRSVRCIVLSLDGTVDATLAGSDR